MAESDRQDVFVSRRDLLRQAPAIAGGAATLAAIPARAQPAKIAQATAGYQDGAQNGQSCGDCRHFTAPASCQLVEGTISPGGWCKLFSAKG